MERLRATIQRGRLLLDLDARSVREIFERAARLVAEQGLIAASLVPDIVGELWRREERVSTAIGHAVAVPHAYLPGVAEAGRWFAPEHLAALDTEEEPAEEESTWM